MSAAGCAVILQVVFLALLAPQNIHVHSKDAVGKPELRVYTVATEATDGFQRFIRSAKKYHHDVQVLGMGHKWKGGDMTHTTGGGQKVNLLREALAEVKDETDTIVMFVDSYDVVLLAQPADIVKAFKKLDASVIFSTEGFCWPDNNLKDQYPVVGSNEKRFLNSGGFIGYAPQVYGMLGQTELKNDDDDQLFFTKKFLDITLREKLKIKLDTRGEIFKNLHGALDEVKVNFKGSTSFLYNLKTGLQPLVAHGNGPIEVEFNSLTNYLVDQWTPTTGCQVCEEGTISLHDTKEEDFPEVLMAVFLEHPIPFVEDFLERLAEQDYPMSRIDLLIHYSVDFHKGVVERFTEKYQGKYKTLRVFTPVSKMTEAEARNKALEECVKKSCEYFFAIDGEAHLEKTHSLQMLIERNRTVIAPKLVRPTKVWSNFWGALSSDGFYRRSEDYIDIVQNKRRGLWNVPYITAAILIHGYRVAPLVGGYLATDLDPDMALARRIRQQGYFMYIDNQEYYGHMVNSDDCDTDHLHGDLYSIFDNPYTWEQKYILPEYFDSIKPESKTPEPCPDVYWFPLATPTFCRHLVEEMENFGEWSGGGHAATLDARIGGYENVPTVDIHTNQIDWERHWLHILRTYVLPMQTKVFEGYYSEGKATMNFVVRYRPGSQDRLKPHNDASTFTVNMSLNRYGIDYQGGGPRYIRYDCKVVDTRIGWLLMNPGRLTHYHEGLPTTNGTRYIMVSFVDP